MANDNTQSIVERYVFALPTGAELLALAFGTRRTLHSRKQNDYWQSLAAAVWVLIEVRKIPPYQVTRLLPASVLHEVRS